jgi:hypothetical protein
VRARASLASLIDPVPASLDPPSASRRFGTYFAFIPDGERSVWNSFASASHVSQQSARKSRTHTKPLIFGAAMKAHFQSAKGKSRYSALMCVLMLLMVGVVVKLGAAVHLFHLAH